MIARLGAARIVAAALATVMLLWLWQALRLRYSADNGQPGPGTWPVWLTLLGLALAVAVIVVETRTMRASSRRDSDPAPEVNAATSDPERDSLPVGAVILGSAAMPADGVEEGVVIEEEGRGTILRPLGALAGMVAFLLLMPVLGFQLGLAIFILYLNLVLIRMPWKLAVAITVVLAVLVNLIFVQFFHVPFPKSVLGI
jgi:Tripartite tricarboxylate transporter TctB family